MKKMVFLFLIAFIFVFNVMAVEDTTDSTVTDDTQGSEESIVEENTSNEEIEIEEGNDLISDIKVKRNGYKKWNFTPVGSTPDIDFGFFSTSFTGSGWKMDLVVEKNLANPYSSIDDALLIEMGNHYAKAAGFGYGALTGLGLSLLIIPGTVMLSFVNDYVNTPAEIGLYIGGAGFTVAGSIGALELVISGIAALVKFAQYSNSKKEVIKKLNGSEELSLIPSTKNIKFTFDLRVL